MKICMIFPTYPPNYQRDGIGDYTRILVGKLRELGHDVYVITSGQYEGEDPNVIKVGDKWGIRDLIKAVNIIKAKKFDVINLQYTPVSYGFGVTFKLLPLLVKFFCNNVVFVTTFHTFTGGRWISKINAFLLVLFSTRIITTHEELMLLYNKWFGIFKNKAKQVLIGSNVAYKAVDVEKVREDLERKYGIGKRSIILVNFGFPNKWKGLEDISKAMRILSKKGDYFLVLLHSVRDEDLPYLYELKGLIRKDGVESRVIWIKNFEESKISGILQASDIFVAPYLDGASTRRGSLIASIVHGMPIVSTLSRVRVPYFKNEENMLLVKVSSPEDLARAIERLVKDKELSNRLRANVKMLSNTFNWERIAKDTLEVYSGCRK